MRIKKFILIVAVALAFLPTQQLYAAPAFPQSDTGMVSPLSHVITWQYKIEGSKIYKRLYNSTTQTWIGDWIYVGEYNP